MFFSVLFLPLSRTEIWSVAGYFFFLEELFVCAQFIANEGLTDATTKDERVQRGLGRKGLIRSQAFQVRNYDNRPFICMHRVE